MKTPAWVWATLAVVAVGHLAIPAYMIRRQERTLREGREYRFRTAPVDPYDAFRGRYVALRFEQDHAPWAGGDSRNDRHDRAFASIVQGEDGFAVVREVGPEPPVDGDFVKVQVSYRGWGTNAGSVYFRLPFDRYYLEETKAPAAERAYLEVNRRGRTNLMTYAAVRVRQGHAALADVVVDGKPIRKLAELEAAQ